VAIVAIRQRDAAFALHGHNQPVPNAGWVGKELQGFLARWDELRRREVSAVNQCLKASNLTEITEVGSGMLAEHLARQQAILPRRTARPSGGSGMQRPPRSSWSAGRFSDHVRQYAGC